MVQMELQILEAGLLLGLEVHMVTDYIKATGGSSSTTLTTSNMPSHTHAFSGTTNTASIQDRYRNNSGYGYMGSSYDSSNKQTNYTYKPSSSTSSNYNSHSHSFTSFGRLLAEVQDHHLRTLPPCQNVPMLSSGSYNY